jgi:hypothetical protein
VSNQEQAAMTIEEALDLVQESWDRLMVTMSSAPEVEYANRRDASGWTPLDHMAHVTAWERSRRHWLLGRPRYEGLGVTRGEFDLDTSELNEIVRSQTAEQTYREVMERAALGHQQVLDAAAGFGFSAQSDSDGITQDEVDHLGGLLVEHLANHYDEHREYIERILASESALSAARNRPGDSGTQQERATAMANQDQNLIRSEAKQALMGMMQAWWRLMDTMTKEEKSEYERKQDARGWTALDHFAHVSAWERSRLTWLQGRPRFEGLGVTSEQFKLDYDELNEIVRDQTTGQGYDEVVGAALSVHQAMVDEIRTFEPDDVPRSGGISTAQIADIGAQITENLTDHYDQHREYIEKILAG